MKHTCMTEKEREKRVKFIDAGGGHCLGLKLQALTDEKRKSEQNCEACQQKKSKDKEKFQKWKKEFEIP